MKTVNTILTTLFVVALLVVGYRSTQMPNDVNASTVSFREDASPMQVFVAGLAMDVQSWEVQDYLVFKTAKSSTGTELVMDPITLKWHVLDR